jgi:radical SAM superfamily enzyme YgiQ (UPF0313 family)
VEWAVSRGIETATFHILTPYPGTALYRRLEEQGRLLHRNWNLYDTRHAVYRPARMTVEELEDGRLQAYRDFYRWGSILQSAAVKEGIARRLQHLAYVGGFKKSEPLWDWIISRRMTSRMLPLLESVLEGGNRGHSPFSYTTSSLYTNYRKKVNVPN